jgi:hypothetical protein
MAASLLRLRVRSAWLLLGAVAALLAAVGYGLFVAADLVRAQTVPVFDAEPDGFAARVGLILQFTGPIPPMLLLLAGVLLAGCLVLTGRLPVQTAAGAQGSVRPIGGSRVRLSLLGLAAVAALLALTYAATAALVLTTDPGVAEDGSFRLLNRSNAVTVLAVSAAALGALAVVVLSAWFSGAVSAGAEAPDDQGDEPGPTSEPPEADTEQVPLPSSPDLLESSPTVSRRRHPT